MPREPMESAVKRWRDAHASRDAAVKDHMEAQPPVEPAVPAQPDHPTQEG